MHQKLTIILIIITIVIAVAAVFQIRAELTPKINRLNLAHHGEVKIETPLTVALLSDLHLSESDRALSDLGELWAEIVSEAPDVILLAGDYTKRAGSVVDMENHRINVSKILGQSNDIPVVAVLGNYETNSAPLLWSMTFRDQGIRVLNNEVTLLQSEALCVRGLGDYFTGQFRYIEFPSECDGLRKISLTHDPAGAFHPTMRGIVLAGHTHCGQIRFPVIGAIFVPTEARQSAQCGLYQDNKITLFVSSGVGTSLLPIRLFAQAQWDLITVN